MARSLKPQKVDEVTDKKTGMTIDIMFNRNDKDFFAVHGPATFRDPTAKAVMTWAHKQLQEAQELQWQPIIKVTYRRINQPDGQNSATIAISATRYFVAVNQAGRPIRADWGTSPDGRETIKNVFEYHSSPPTRTTRRIGLYERAMAFHWNDKEDGPFRVPLTVKRQFRPDYDVLLPYDMETWLGILELIETIRQANDALENLLQAESGIERIGQVGAALLKALPSGEPEQVKE